jgi:hypothetical protein
MAENTSIEFKLNDKVRIDGSVLRCAGVVRGFCGNGNVIVEWNPGGVHAHDPSALQHISVNPQRVAALLKTSKTGPYREAL